MLSLFNFLSLVFSSVLGHAGGNGLSLVPRLAQYQSTTARLRKMREENETMKSKLTALENVLRSKHGLTLNDVTCPEIFPPDEVMDDFCIIAQEASTSTESQAKTLKSFLRTFTGGGGTSTTVAPSPNPSHGSSSFTSSSSDRKSLTGKKTDSLPVSFQI